MPVIVEESLTFASSVPVIVVGAGAAGVMAALAARKAGAKVLLLDRDAAPFGASGQSSGMIPAAATAAQVARGIEDSPARFAADVQLKSNRRSNPLLVDAYTQQAASVLDWLHREHGMEFELVEGVPPGHSVARMHALVERGGAALMLALVRALASAGVRLMASTRVTDLITDRQQRVRGVRYRRGESTVGEVGCSALILATNGFGANPDLVARHLPDVRALPFAGHDGSMGDALAWGGELDAASADLDGFLAHSSIVMPQRHQMPWALMSEGAIQVNREGERFGNEHEGYSESALFVLAQTDGVAFNIFDERIHEVGLAMPGYPEAVAQALVKRGATLRELAEVLGVDADGLQQSVAMVNALAFEEATDDFGRVFRAAQMVLTPYYGVKVTGALLGTEGGLAIDAGGRVLRTSGEAFPNLLAAGGAARGISGDAGGGYLEGNGLLAAVVGGWLAGRTAAGLAY